MSSLKRVVSIFLAVVVALTMVPNVGVISFAETKDLVSASSDASSVVNGIPVLNLTIDEKEFEKMYNSEKHVYKASGCAISIDVPDGYKGEFSDTELKDISDLPLEYIRGRGNSTWGGNKRPYKIKLKKSTDLLGMGKNKHWCLMANAYDTTLLRNRLASYLGRALGMDFVPKSTPVDLTVNGRYVGSYTLSHQIRVGSSRVDIDELTNSDNSEPNITGGYLISMCPYSNEPEENVFITNRGVEFKTDNPAFASEDADDTVGTKEQREYITKYLQDTEDAIFSIVSSDASSNAFMDYMDIQSAANYWWIQEFSANGDAYRTPSTYLYKTRDEVDSKGNVIKKGKLYWGPLWDFDLSFSLEDVVGFYNSDMEWNDILRAYSPEYQAMLKSRWAVMNSALTDVCKDGGVLDQYAAELKKSWDANYKLYPEMAYGVMGSDVDDPEGKTITFDEEVKALKDWIKNRQDWINANIDSSITKVYAKVDFSIDGKVVKTSNVRINGFYEPGDIPGEDVTNKQGYVFVGWKDQDGNMINTEKVVYDDASYIAVYKDEASATYAKNVYFRDYDVYLDKDSTEPSSINYKVTPTDSDVKKVTWESSNPSVVEVKDGEMFTKGVEGEAVITAKLPKGGTNSFTVHVVNTANVKPVPDYTFALESKSLTLKPGEYGQVKYTTKPAYTDEIIMYESSDEEIAEIIGCGVIRAIKPGTCTIKAVDYTSNVEKEFKLTVSKYDNSMVVKGKTVSIKAKSLKKKGIAKAITVTSADGKVCYKLSSVSKAKFKKYFKVNSKTGKITVKKGLRKGTYTVKVSVKAAGNKKYASATKKVSVKILVY